MLLSAKTRQPDRSSRRVVDRATAKGQQRRPAAGARYPEPLTPRDYVWAAWRFWQGWLWAGPATSSSITAATWLWLPQHGVRSCGCRSILRSWWWGIWRPCCWAPPQRAFRCRCPYWRWRARRRRRRGWWWWRRGVWRFQRRLPSPPRTRPATPAAAAAGAGGVRLPVRPPVRRGSKSRSSGRPGPWAWGWPRRPRGPRRAPAAATAAAPPHMVTNCGRLAGRSCCRRGG